MYNVSDDFRSVMKMPAQTRRLYGTIGTFEFKQKNILQGTFSITNQCSDNSNIQIGQVYIGELKATFRGLNIPRNSWKGKEIIAYQGLKVNDTFEDVLIGHYFIDDANWSKAGVDVTAYDAMSKFDKNLSLTTSSGTVFDFISYACDVCKVELGMTKEEMSNFPNGQELLGIYDENDMETYRDLIAWCAQATGSNALINREGKLIFKQYSDTILETFSSTQRLDGGTISDFDSFYTGISVVNIKLKTTSYYGAEVDDGLTMNLGSNPLLQYGTDETIEKQRRAVLTAIQNINYTPMKMKLNVPYIYDLMDVLEFTDGIVGNGSSIKAAITKYTWKFNGDYEVECSGSDPALASGKSKVDKNIAGLLEQVDAAKTITYKFVNTKDLDIIEDFTKIISITFTSKEKASALFLAQILLDVTADEEDKEITGTANYTEEVVKPKPNPDTSGTPDTNGKEDSGSENKEQTEGSAQTTEENAQNIGTTSDTTKDETIKEEVEVSKVVKFNFKEKKHPVVQANYKLNNEPDEIFIPKQSYHEGSHILTLYYPLMSVKDNTSSTFEVFLNITGGKGTIKKANIIGTIFGQGLVADYYEWDGNIKIEESFPKTLLTKAKIGIKTVSDILDVGFDLPKKNGITDNFAKLIFNKTNALKLVGFNDSIGSVGPSVDVVQTQQTVTFDSLTEYMERDEESNIQLKITYEYIGAKGEIDDGKICSVKAITADKVSIQEINVEVIN